MHTFKYANNENKNSIIRFQRPAHTKMRWLEVIKGKQRCSILKCSIKLWLRHKFVPTLIKFI